MIPSPYRQPTAEELAEVVYRSYLKRSREYDPRLRPMGLLEWERLPSLSKDLLAECMEDLLDELY